MIKTKIEASVTTLDELVLVFAGLKAMDPYTDDEYRLKVIGSNLLILGAAGDDSVMANILIVEAD